MGTKLYVGGLPYAATEAELTTLFATHGPVESARIIADKFTGQSKGFGFIEISTAAEAQAAITALNGSEMGGRSLTVNEARPMEPRSGGGGRSGGALPGAVSKLRRARRSTNRVFHLKRPVRWSDSLVAAPVGSGQGFGDVTRPVRLAHMLLAVTICNSDPLLVSNRERTVVDWLYGSCRSSRSSLLVSFLRDSPHQAGVNSSSMACVSGLLSQTMKFLCPL